MFKTNMHNVDRILRVVAGTILVYFGFYDTGWITNIIIPFLLGLIGLVNFMVAATGYCPLYTLAGYNFAKQENKK